MDDVVLWRGNMSENNGGLEVYKQTLYRNEFCVM